MTLTTNERDALAAFWRSEYTDGEETPSTWAWSVTDNCQHVTPRSIAGVISSLVKKGLVTVCGSGDEAQADVTDEGFAAARDAGIIVSSEYTRWDGTKGQYWEAVE